MNRKIVVLSVILVLTGAAGLFAQEAYIKPTLSAGIAVRTLEDGAVDAGVGGGNGYDGHSETYLMAALGLDVDFVSTRGLTFGFHSLNAFGGEQYAFYFVSFGGGYTYTSQLWSVGAKVMGTPHRDGGIGLDVNGTYWFSDYVGLTGIMNFYIGLGEYKWNMFSARVGLSMYF